MGNSHYHLLCAAVLTLFVGSAPVLSQDSLVIEDEPKPDTQAADSTVPAPASGVEDEEKSAGESTLPSARLQITRRTVENFLTDPLALIPFGGGGDAIPTPLISTFVIAVEGTPYSIIWDPTACRLLGVYRTPDPAAPVTEGEPPSPYVLLAEGPAPFSTSLGAFGNPSYFGFRIVDGYPEFLYHYGRLLIEERIWMESSGNELMQQFSVKHASGSISMKFPESWKERITPSKGEWKQDDMLNVPAEKDEEAPTSFVLSYKLEADGE